MDRSIYLRLQEKARKTAEEIGVPSFYGKCSRELDVSASFLKNNRLLAACRTHLNESALHPAHGIAHCEKVALEAGALAQIEGAKSCLEPASKEMLMICSQLAGLLHDIKRKEDNHAVAGSIAADKILGDLGLEDRYRSYVVSSIRNHEAFKETADSEDELAGLVSDSLYDADKFRWGPDNFTSTLWLIAESTSLPVEKLYASFKDKLEWIKKIKFTFRSETGKKYGPEFIDFGLEIAQSIFEEMHTVIG